MVKQWGWASEAIDCTAGNAWEDYRLKKIIDCVSMKHNRLPVIIIMTGILLWHHYYYYGIDNGHVPLSMEVLGVCKIIIGLQITFNNHFD